MKKLPAHRIVACPNSQLLRRLNGMDIFHIPTKMEIFFFLFIPLNAGDACPRAISNTSEKLKFVADSHEIHYEKDTRILPHAIYREFRWVRAFIDLTMMTRT